ncbi:MAG: DUF3311 domain-containing protein [Halanaeroarchaeum sp.]
MTEPTPSRRSIGWGVVFALLASLSIPWFLWGSSRVVWGLPIWIWYHVGWMALTSATFAVFARTDWGRFVEVES